MEISETNNNNNSNLYEWSQEAEDSTNLTFASGQNVYGQTGISSEDDIISNYTLNSKIQGMSIQQIECGKQHSAILTLSGNVLTTGNNEKNQLGREGRTRIFSSIPLPNVIVKQIVVGDFHCLALDENGHAFSWGDNTFGQLGQGDTNSRSTPTLISDIKKYEISRVGAGANHSFLLTKMGDAFAFGDNSCGQLGCGDTQKRVWPRPLDKLRGLPIIKMCGGQKHSLLLTAGGSVYSVGSNLAGQCGQGNEIETILEPRRIRSLQKKIIDIQVGDNHSVFLSEDKQLFTCGAALLGQCGNGSIDHNSYTASHIPLPQPVESISAKGNITIVKLALPLPNSSNYVLGFGSNQNYELGTGPKVIRTPTPLNIQNNPLFVSAGYTHSFVFFGPKVDLVTLSPPLHSLNLEIVRSLIDSHQFTELNKLIANTFEHPAGLNASFLEHANHKTYFCSNETGLDIEEVAEVYRKILNCNSPSTISTLAQTIKESVEQISKLRTFNVETLRMLSIVWQSPLFLNCGKHNIGICEKFFSKIRSDSFKLFWNELASFPSQFYLPFVQSVMSFLNFAISENLDTLIVIGTSLLKQLYQLNQENHIIPRKFFMIRYDTLTKRDLQRDYLTWISKNQHLFSLCDYPFLLPTASKLELWRMERLLEMKKTMAQNMVPIDPSHVIIPILGIQVRRDHLLEDTFQTLSQISDYSKFKLPLKIKFENEEGIDEGGLSKEFFSLLSKELFNPDYGLFIRTQDTRLTWFAPSIEDVPETKQHFFYAGVLVGLSVYHNILVDVRFPLLLYKKLLNLPVSPSDLYDLMPGVYSSLQKLIHFKGDFEDLDLCFSVSENHLGQMKQIPLMENGAEIEVTSRNVDLYIEKVTEYYLETKTKEQFENFQKGFLTVVQSPMLQLFGPEELKMLQEGEDNLDLNKLQEITEYEGYTKDSPTIQHFWKVVGEFSELEKKLFFQFFNGSARVPTAGATLKIIRNAETKSLPSSSTCFNIIALPDYQDEALLKDKLLKAIKEGGGFYLQ